MKYKILYNYNTGDSFHNEDELEDTIELEWNNREVALANLKRIEEHYKFYRQMNKDYPRLSKKQIKYLIWSKLYKDWLVKDRMIYRYPKANPSYGTKIANYGETHNYIEDEVWGIKTELDYSAMTNQLILYTDQGKPFRFWPSWIGYFESLNYVELKEENTRIEF